LITNSKHYPYFVFVLVQLCCFYAIRLKILGYKNFETHPIRKRERLNHLTAEEKLNRRKLKNRVAAQTARDRKKIRTTKLEEAVRKLVAENELLRAENKRINSVCDQLKIENSELKNALAVKQQQNSTERVEPEVPQQLSIESAAFIRGPQQREQAIVVALTRVFLLLSFLTSACKKSSMKHLKMMNLNNSVRRYSTAEIMMMIQMLMRRSQYQHQQRKQKCHLLHRGALRHPQPRKFATRMKRIMKRWN
uniref:X-box-binding protein 1 n=1 Tax=Syphacia muris TaxID=451379 RepID=A0A0N5AI57_9BILA